LENLKVTTTVTNTGDETLKLLNDPRGALSPFPENTFSITDPNGSSPSFNGAKVKYSPRYAAGLDDPSVFTVLNPGASVDVTHDLSGAYNFTRTGAGDYSIKPSNLFTYVDADGIPRGVLADIKSAKVKLSGNLAVTRAHKKRASFVSCSSTRQTELNTAATNAVNYASDAYSYLVGLTSGKPRYTTWFGNYTSSYASTVETHFSGISSSVFSSFTYDCTCTDAGTYAYVYPDSYGTIYLCGAYWNAPATGTDSQGGTLVHECSHFTINGGTQDYVYGQDDAKALAISNPAEAIFNADNHEYFAENNPAQS